MSPELIGCPGCGTIQELPPRPERGRLVCWHCEHVLERSTGRSIDAPLACSIATLMLLLPANFLPVMTVHVAGVTDQTHLASGLATAWRQGWPVVTAVLALQGILLPFFRFGLLAVTLGAIRLGVHGPWAGRAFRYTEALDSWAMVDVLAIGFGVGYGRVAANIPVTIDAGGWCFLCTALLTMLTRACTERRAIWRAVGTPPGMADPAGDPAAIVCTSCCLVVVSELEGEPCPRCAAALHRRRPLATVQCTALVAACWALMPIAYGLPMSEFWEAGIPHPHSIVDGIRILLNHGFWPLAVLIFCTSVGIPFGKLIGLTWFLLSIHQGSSRALRRKTRLYEVVDAAGRWSNLDPFTVMIFAPMVQFGQLAHIDIEGGSLAFLSMVVLSMMAARAFDPRLIWDAAEKPAGLPLLAGGH